jgi:Raf kinase inhibitor-like YbhB/YbcL family protein
MALQLTSPEFGDGGGIPIAFTCDGNGHSPELSITGQPGPTQSFVLVTHDPDAPKGDFTHWLLWDIPAETRTLTKGVTLHSVGVSGPNSAGQLGYRGPCPPPGTGPHHYHFDLYALDVGSLEMPEGSTLDQIEAAMRGHILGRARLTGIFERKEGSSPPTGS